MKRRREKTRNVATDYAVFFEYKGVGYWVPYYEIVKLLELGPRRDCECYKEA
jgi:hypothetical protein